MPKKYKTWAEALQDAAKRLKPILVCVDEQNDKDDTPDNVWMVWPIGTIDLIGHRSSWEKHLGIS